MVEEVNETLIKNLLGHSGCKLALYRCNRGLFVRKVSATLDYNKRLELQSIKQRTYQSRDFLVPRILHRGFNAEGLFFFDMEFIHCDSMDKLFHTIPMPLICNLVEKLFNTLQIGGTSSGETVAPKIQAKLQRLKATIAAQMVGAHRAISILERYKFWLVPDSECHGDLTLENIMLAEDGKIYLIDFLDSFIDSWIMDVAKILQDVELKWAYRFCEINANLEVRLLFAREEIVKHILAMRQGSQLLASIYHLLLLNVVRIYPYTQDEVTFTFLENAIEQVLCRITELEK